VPPQRQVRHVGDTEVAIAATLQRPDGTAVNLTGLTVKFRMVAVDGTTKVAETASNVTVTDEASGQVQYNPQAADVDTAGVYHAYFVVIDGSSNRDTFPVKNGDLVIIITDDV